MSKRYFFAIPAFIFACILMGCGGSAKTESKPTLGKEKMMSVLWDLAQADAFTEQFVKRDSSLNPGTEQAKLQQQIFHLHQVKKEDVYSSYQYYLNRPELMKEILDSVADRAERDRIPMIQAEQTEKFEQIRKADEEN
jgi:hypothetical protein